MTVTTDTETPVIPDFGDDEPDRKICFVCSKGTLDMAYPALIMANGALGEGIETHIFFTFWGMDMITKDTMGDLKFTILGNPATHMPQGLGGLPFMTSMATKMMKKQIADLEVPEVPEFLQMLSDMGAHLWACRMSVDMMDLDEDDLFDDVEDVINVAEFIEITDGAQVVFV
jgi:peroxiredoxin family protein